MKLLYIAPYGYGSTSRMRGEMLKSLLPAAQFQVMDMDIPITATPKIFRSAAWRWYRGPLIGGINRYILSCLGDQSSYDAIWIDKGVFIQPDTLATLRKRTGRLIHYTPDTAFRYNRSALFYRGIGLYDHCITTKSFELEAYRAGGARNVLFCTQGYDPELHHPYPDLPKKDGVCFIGLYEPWRGACIGELLKNGVHIHLAGEGWDSFCRKHAHLEQLTWHGRGLFGEAYARLIAGSLVGLGLLSKKFPELHTTRTFEIPACGTLLATERNKETETFFDPRNAIFFETPAELSAGIVQVLADPARLNRLSAAGRDRVISLGADYKSILKTLLRQTGITT